jgi:hypothetical protein
MQEKHVITRGASYHRIRKDDAASRSSIVEGIDSMNPDA